MDILQYLNQMLTDRFEQICEQTHNAWWVEKKKEEFHQPNECPSQNHKGFQNADWQSQDRFEDLHDPKFHKWCAKCHPDMYSYAELPNNIQEYDRATVRAVLLAIENL